MYITSEKTVSTKCKFAMVYFLILPSTNGFKIGKTINLNWRFFDLRTQYHIYDLENSFFIQVPYELGIPYERFMKTVVKKYGREVFSIEGFKKCLKTAIDLCQTKDDLVLTPWEIEDWLNRQCDLRDNKLELNTN